MSADHASPSPDPHDPDAAYEEFDGVIIDSWNVTRVVFHDAPEPRPDSLIKCDCVVTIDNCFVVEDVQIRVCKNDRIEVTWPYYVDVMVEGIRFLGKITERVRRRLAKRLMRIFAESDLGAELP